MTVSPPEDGDVAFFSSGMAQRLSTADSVASEYSVDQPVGYGSGTQQREDVPYGVAAEVTEEPTQKKGFVRLTGARMARTLDNSEPGSSSTARPDQGFDIPGRSSTPHAVPRNVDDLSRQMQQTHIQPKTTDHTANQFWDSSRYNPGPTSQIIPSLPTLSTVSSAPVLRRDMSISRKSMVGEMGEYGYEDDGTGRGSPGSLSPRSSQIRKGKAVEEMGQSRSALGHRNSRMHYTRRPAPPPPPVPIIPANFISSGARGDAWTGPSSGVSQYATGADLRSPTIRNTSFTNHTSPSPRHLESDSRRPSYTQLTPEERRARIAEDYLAKGITAHNDTTGMHDLTESAYYFRKAAEGGSSGGCVLYGESHHCELSAREADVSAGLALRHG